MNTMPRTPPATESEGTQGRPVPLARIHRHAPNVVVDAALGAGPPPAPSTSAVAVRPQISWLSIEGSLADEVAAADLARVLHWQQALGYRFVWLDLSQVPTLGRHTLDVLLEAHRRFQAGDATLVLTGISPRIARLLELTEADQTLCTMDAESVLQLGPGGQRGRAWWADGHASMRDDTADEDATPIRRVSPSGRRMIDRAVGVVMGRTHCGTAEATEHLLALSRATGRRPVEVARSILNESSRSRQRTAQAASAFGVRPRTERGDDTRTG